MISVTPFEVIVTNPLRPEKEGGLVKGTKLTVRFVIPDQQADGKYLIYFVVWNEAKKNFMLELAVQFEPIEK